MITLETLRYWSTNALSGPAVSCEPDEEPWRPSSLALHAKRLVWCLRSFTCARSARADPRALQLIAFLISWLSPVLQLTKRISARLRLRIASGQPSSTTPRSPSSIPIRPSRSMTLPQYALDYDTCTYKEKRAFVKARTPRERSAKIKQKVRAVGRVRVLQDFDKEVMFRFMDLLPEVRVLVYQHLLTKDHEKDSIAYPAILRTCKKVYEEAQEVLHVNSPIDLHIRIEPRVIERPTEVMVYHSARMRIGPGRYIEHHTLKSPKHLARPMNDIKHLMNVRLHVDFVGMFKADTPSSFYPITALTPLLKALVDTCKDMRQVSLEWDDCTTRASQHRSVRVPVTDSKYEALRKCVLEGLAPLAQLPSNCTLYLDDVGEDIYEDFWNLARGD